MDRASRKANVEKVRKDFRKCIMDTVENEFRSTSPGACAKPFTHAMNTGRLEAERVLSSTPPQQHHLLRPVIRELKSMNILPQETKES